MNFIRKSRTKFAFILWQKVSVAPFDFTFNRILHEL